MKLQADISGTKHEVEVEHTDDSVRAVVDGREYSLDVSNPEPGLYLLRNGSKNTLAHVSQSADGSSMVAINGRTIKVALSDPKRLRGSSVGEESVHGRAEIKTAMPGKVVRIMVAEGDAVVTGDGVIVVEAMKMQNEMRSPKDGTITKICVVEGDNVGAGDVLVVIE